MPTGSVDLGRRQIVPVVGDARDVAEGVAIAPHDEEMPQRLGQLMRGAVALLSRVEDAAGRHPPVPVLVEIDVAGFAQYAGAVGQQVFRRFAATVNLGQEIAE